MQVKRDGGISIRLVVAGSVFISSNKVYVKTDALYDGVNLETGQRITFSEDAKVIIVNAEVSVNYFSGV